MIAHNRAAIKNGKEDEWTDIQGYEGHYKISSSGEIASLSRIIVMKNGKSRRIRGKRIFAKVKENGYLFVQLYLNGKATNRYIHRLVAEHFLENISCLSDVNHIDGNKSNNSFDNLEWVTHSENLIHAYDTGLKKYGEEHQQSKLSSADVLFIRQNYKPYDEMFGAKPLAKRFGVGRPTISAIARNLKRKHG
jgi:hypothetical protein